MEQGDEGQALVEFFFRDWHQTRTFYEALGGEAALVECMHKGRKGFLFRLAGVTTLRLVQEREGDDPAPKHGSLLIRNLIPPITRLKERGFDGALGVDGALRDPFGNVFSVGCLGDPIYCLDVKRTVRFYEILGAWTLGGTERQPTLLLCESSLVPFVEGWAEVRSWVITLHVSGPTASVVDNLNHAGFGPFDLLTSELTEPDGRLVRLVPVR